MKKTFLAFVFASLFVSMAYAETEPSIYFSFDHGVRADYGGVDATGNVTGLREATGVEPKVQAKNADGRVIDTGKLLVEGLSGKAIAIGQQSGGEICTLRYDVTPRLSAAHGSVSFWVKPMNWDGTDNGVFRHFFSAKSAGGGPHWIFIYKHNKTDTIFFYYGGDGKNAKFSQAISTVKEWKKGEWHHLGAVWSNEALVFYIDGRQTALVPMNQVMDRDLDFFLLGEHWSGDPGSTLIDELRIFDAPLSQKEMEAEYLRLADKARNGREAQVVITAAKRTPVLDGAVSDFEYSALVGGMMDYAGLRNNFAVMQGKTGFAWDDESLYFSMTTPSGKLLSAQKGRDSMVYMDDSVELHVKTRNNQYQFIFNYAGTLFDMRNRDISWNGSDIRSISKTSGKDWILEVAIPWSTLETTADQEGRLLVNAVRNYTEPKMQTQIAPTRSGFHEYELYAELRLDRKAPSYDVSQLGELFNMQLDCNVRVMSEDDGGIRMRFDADAPVFSVNTDQTFKLEAGRLFSHKVSRKLPENKTLLCRLETTDGVLLYKTKMDYVSPEGVKLWYIYTDLEKAEIVFVMRNSILNAGENTIRMDFLMSDGKKSVHTATSPISDKKPTVEVRFPLKGLPAGRYDLQYTLLDASGRQICKDMEEYEYFKDGAPWDGIQDGLEDTLPAPWTPVSGEGGVFNCWGRTVKLGGAGLLASIVSADHEILSRPVLFKVNGEEVAFLAECVMASPTKAVYELTPKTAEVPVSFNVVAEFDGFMRFEGKVKPNAEINGITLEIPLSKEFADGFDDCHSCYYKNSLVGKDVSLDINTVQKPHFWCGSERAGIMGGTWTKRGWHIKDKDKSMLVRSNEKETILTINIADTKYRTGDNGETFSFFLNPTPVKPLRKWDELPFERKNMMLAGATSSRFFFYYVPGYFDNYKDWIIERFKKDGRTPLEKVNLLSSQTSKGVSPMSPAWNYFCTDWVNPPPALGAYSADIQDARKRHVRNRYVFTYGCHNSRSFHEFQIYCAKNSLEGKKYGQRDVTDMYFDLAWPKPCGNVLHGCCWVDEFGDTMRNNDLLTLRDYHLRVYRMMKKKNPNGYFAGHVFYSRTPSDNFFDYIVAGEMYDHYVYKKLSYYDVFDPELMRIAYTCRANEMTVSLMPQFLRGLECYAPERIKEWDPFTPKNDRAVKHFMAYCSIFGMAQTHDIWCAGQKLPPPGKGQVEIWSEAFGRLGDSPTYKRGLKTLPEDSRILSATYSGNGKTMALILNDTDQAKTFRINVGTGSAVGTDIFSKRQYKAEDGYLPMTLEGREAAMVLFE